MHPDLFPHWLAERRKNRFPDAGPTSGMRATGLFRRN
jgi:hypothetical protein